MVGRVSLTRSFERGIPNVGLTGQFLVEVNTFAAAKSINTFKIKTRQPGGSFGTAVFFDGFDTDATGKPKFASQSIDPGFRFLLAGHLVIANFLDISAEVKFSLNLSGGSPSIELIVNGSVNLAPIGSVNLVDSGFRINAQGLVARVSSWASTRISSGVASASSSRRAPCSRSTRRVRTQTLGSSQVEAGFRLRLDGSVEFLNFASATGFLDIKITSSSLELAAGLKFTIGPLSFDVNGSLGIFSDGLTATLNVSLDVNLLSLFDLKMSGSLQLDTRASHTKFFRLALSGKLSVLGGMSA